MNIVRLAVTVLALAIAGPASSQSHGQRPAITGLQAFLFENKTGRLSGDVLGAERNTLWNRIAGAHASNAVLVVVEIAGPPGMNYSARNANSARYTIRLTAVESRRRAPVLDEAQPLPILNDDGKAYVPFLVRPGGCSSVRLAASITGVNPPERLEKSIDYACGE